MSATTQPTDFSDLYTELLNKTRSITTGTAVPNQAKRYINSALYDMILGFEFQMPWLERTSVLRTHEPYTTGTVSVSVGSTALTGVSTLWNTANSYGENNARTTGKLKLGGADIYNITTVGSDTSITLTQRYVGSAALSASTYTYFEDEYALASDFLKIATIGQFSSVYNIPLIGRLDYTRMYPRPNIAGLPRVATILEKGFGATTAPVRRVQFYPYPGGTYNLPYLYITNNLAVSSTGTEAAALSADSDEPNLPVAYRHLIVLKALAMWYRDKKDDARAREAQEEYGTGLARLVGSMDMGRPRVARIQPRMSGYEAHARKPYSGRAPGRYSHNDSFDYME